ncbi:putative transmembrane protein, partial [Rhizoctonia solani 123E]
PSALYRSEFLATTTATTTATTSATTTTTTTTTTTMTVAIIVTVTVSLASIACALKYVTQVRSPQTERRNAE